MTLAELKDIRLTSIAGEYRNRGYRVVVRPEREDLPPFLASFEPDLVAFSEKDNVVLRVATPEELKTGPSMTPLAAVIEQQRGWRLALSVVTFPAIPELPENPELVSDARIDALLREARELSGERRDDAAAIVAWSAAEAVLRRLAHDNGEDVHGRYTGTVIKQLYTMGLLGDDEYHQFMHAMEFRDAFAHGLDATAGPDYVTRLLRDVEAVRGRVYEPFIPSRR